MQQLAPPAPTEGLSSPPPAIEVRRLTVAYHRAVALDDVSVAFPPRAVTAIVGPNGAGKTTLLQAIVGLLPLQGGDRTVFGQPIRRARRRVAYVPQREAVDWHFPVTVRDVVLMGRYAAAPLRRRPSAADRAIAAAALDQVGLAAYAGRQIGTLSGGQQQRVFIARALAQQADALLLDEPFAGIDAASQETIFGLLAGLRDAGQTVLLSTHDLMSVRAHCDYLLCLNRRVIAFGPARATFRLDVLEQTYGGRLFHLHEGEGVILP
ncbi:MAG TPA: metal ABC transporter ATP-binding protein [Thermomicrobiales bacterium]|nr:metal ABC transporter ATP-binding protein [Thermomicrobiales bacterium]